MPARPVEPIESEGSGVRPNGSELLNVALIGAGMISAFHLTAWKQLKGVRVVAVVDPDLARAQRRAAEFGIPAFYGSLDEMFARETLDAIDIASPRELIRRSCVARQI